MYDGQIHKCPNCGEILKAFDIVCPMCQYELRGVKTSSSVKDLTEKLERATTESQKITIIKSFPVPNTTEDIFEFMILASSNFDASYYAAHMNEEDISDAWLAKIEQCYQKAKWMLSSSSHIANIEAMYNKILSDCEAKKKQAEKQESRRLNKWKRARNRAMLARIAVIGILVLLAGGIVFGIWKGIESINTSSWSVFHDSGEIKIGLSDEEIQGQYYEDIVELLEEKGFVNIEAREDGWSLFHKSGTIKTITIDGKEDFSSHSEFSENAKIVILYYS